MFNQFFVLVSMEDKGGCMKPADLLGKETKILISDKQD